MRWKCFLVDSKPYLGDEFYRPGAMWFGERSADPFTYDMWPSDEFMNSSRKPLYVLLPSNARYLEYFFIDMKDYEDKGGWRYTGTPPIITVTPSINCVGRYHGYVQDGYVSKDVEGRTYPMWEQFGEKQ